ncbi:MAG: ATP-binding protein [Verrucomicrobiia bacterium]
MANNLLIYCHCARAKVLPQDVREEVLKNLCQSGAQFLAISDLCGVCSSNEAVWLQEKINIKMFACHPRAVKWLLYRVGIEVNEKSDCFDMRSKSASELKKELSEILSDWNETSRAVESVMVDLDIGEKQAQDYKAVRAIKFKETGDSYFIIKRILEEGYSVFVGKGNGWDCLIFAGHPKVVAEFILSSATGLASVKGKDCIWVGDEELDALIDSLKSELAKGALLKWYPWFPVIDYDRCTHCMQCLSFCLFGVYGANEDGKLRIVNAESCKTNCPACARVCPEMAIIFPKHQSEPINGGEIPESEEQSQLKQKVDISLLLGGDIYEKLRSRSRQATERFSSERSAERALEERRRCLAEIARFVPPEVLAALPSQEEIQRRAKEAAEKARQALNIKKGLEK